MLLCQFRRFGRKSERRPSCFQRNAFPSASLKKSPMFLPHNDEPVTVVPGEFDGRKLEPTTKDGSDLGDEDEKNKLEELTVIIVVGGDAEYIKKL